MNTEDAFIGTIVFLALWTLIALGRIMHKLILAMIEARKVSARLGTFVSSVAPPLPAGDVGRLVTLYSALPDGERKVLDHIAHRMLDVGLPAYGPMDLANDKRDFAVEEQQELYDACVYRALGNLRREASRKPGDV